MVLCLFSSVTEDTPLPSMSGVCLRWCHEDSPVDSVDPLPFSDNDGIVISECCVGSNSLCTDAVKIILCICLDKRRESKTFCMLHESIISSFRYEYISLDSDAMCRLIHPLFPFVYSMVVFYSLFRGTSLFFLVHTLTVMSQFVQWGMMCCWEWSFFFFFQVKLFETGFSSYSEISFISLFFNYV